MSDPEFARLRAEFQRRVAENEQLGRDNALLKRAVAVMGLLKAAADAWSDEAHAMVRQRNALADRLAALTGEHAGTLIEEVRAELGETPKREERS